MLIDTHAHLNFNAYKDDADEVIRRSFETDIWIINVGSQYETSKRAVKIAEKHEKGVYASVGLHPLHLATDLVKIKNDTEEIEIKTREESFDYEKYKELAQNPKVVAIGEVGLDYYWKPKTKGKLELFKEKQRTVLCQQLELAKELGLPVIFHCRMAHKDLIEILNTKYKIQDTNPRGVMHGFVGTTEQLKEYLDIGFYIGFNGIIFKKIEGIAVDETSSHLHLRSASPRSVFDEIIRQTPLEKILIETDCPYLTPPSARRNSSEGGHAISERNEPVNVKYVAQKIAEIKNIDFEKVAETTTQNAKNLFRI